MKHLTPDEITAAIAGLEIGDDQARHLESCMVCRSRITRFDEVVAARRDIITAQEPDWETGLSGVMDRLPTSDRTVGAYRRPKWFRPALALAATVIIAVGVGVLLPDREAVQPTSEEIAVEEILAEMDELLSDDRIPGFEAIDPGLDDLTSYIDNGAS